MVYVDDFYVTGDGKRNITMKEKKIEDFIHLYLGCEVQVTTTGLQGPPNVFYGIMRGYILDQWREQKLAPAIQVYINPTTYYYYKIDQVKLLLRPLSSMTEEEKLELFEIQYGEDKYQALSLQFAIATDSLSAEALHYLLSKGFDVFKLIPAKLALDKTLVKN